MYAAVALRVNSPDATEVALNEVLESDEESWAAEMQNRSLQGQLDEAAFMAAIRRRMERVVLTLDSGSHAQRIQVGLWGCTCCTASLDQFLSSARSLASLFLCPPGSAPDLQYCFTPRSLSLCSWGGTELVTHWHWQVHGWWGSWY